VSRIHFDCDCHNPRTGGAQVWNTSPTEAIEFYSAIVAPTLLDPSLSFMGVNRIKALFWGRLEPTDGRAFDGCDPLIIVSANLWIMGKFVLLSYLKVVGWLATGPHAGYRSASLRAWKASTTVRRRLAARNCPGRVVRFARTSDLKALQAPESSCQLVSSAGWPSRRHRSATRNRGSQSSRVNTSEPLS
jgi:hypothetical protein